MTTWETLMPIIYDFSNTMADYFSCDSIIHLNLQCVNYIMEIEINKQEHTDIEYNNILVNFKEVPLFHRGSTAKRNLALVDQQHFLLTQLLLQL